MVFVADPLSLVWGSTNPYSGFQAKRFRPDNQGWNSNHNFLIEGAGHPEVHIIVEVGVWKGGSTLTMADTLRSRGKQGSAVIAVDTFLGSWEHWSDPSYFKELLTTDGYPQLFYTFLTNIVEAKLETFVVPLPLDSGNASQLLRLKSVTPDLVHIDGGHDFDAVSADLTRWWALLRPGGIMIVDDYDEEGRVWPSVLDAVTRFRQSHSTADFRASPYKCWLRKML